MRPPFIHLQVVVTRMRPTRHYDQRDVIPLARVSRDRDVQREFSIITTSEINITTSQPTPQTTANLLSFFVFFKMYEVRGHLATRAQRDLNPNM